MRKPILNNILTKEFSMHEYILNKKSIYRISKEIGCDGKSVYNYINTYGLERQPTHYPNRKNNSHPLWKGYYEISSTFWNNVKNGAKNRKILFDIKIEDAWEL